MSKMDKIYTSTNTLSFCRALVSQEMGKEMFWWSVGITHTYTQTHTRTHASTHAYLHSEWCLFILVNSSIQNTCTY